MIEIKVAKNGKYYWTLKARNGAILITSEMFQSRNSCMNSIATVRQLIVDAEIVNG